MSLFNQLFKGKDKPIKTYDDFWSWFKTNEKLFYGVVKSKGDIHRFFFEKLGAKLAELRPGIFFLTGMDDNSTVELVLTPDGWINNIYYIEELVAAAPQLKGWQFTALKAASDIKNTVIEMAGIKYAAANLKFYANNDALHPDNIDIVVVHDDYNDENRTTITTGINIFLDNFLGELNFATIIDCLTVVSKEDAPPDLIPIEKLKDYLKWRQAEFIEKYEGFRHDTEKDTHSLLEVELENGNMLFALVNTDLMNWDGKASHPWLLHVEVKYGDGIDNNGMPETEVSELLTEFEDELGLHLKDSDGYLTLCHTTGEGERSIYFACKEFRAPAKVLDNIIPRYPDKVQIKFDVYKDKYWQTLTHFATPIF